MAAVLRDVLRERPVLLGRDTGDPRERGLGTWLRRGVVVAETPPPSGVNWAGGARGKPPRCGTAGPPDWLSRRKTLPESGRRNLPRWRGDDEEAVLGGVCSVLEWVSVGVRGGGGVPGCSCIGGEYVVCGCGLYYYTFQWIFLSSAIISTAKLVFLSI